MKKTLAIVLLFVLFVVTGCNTNKAKINTVSVDNVEYMEDRNILSFDVTVKPNRFDELKVYFITEKLFDENNYGDYWKAYESKLPDGKFTLSLDGYEKTNYVLFVYAKGFDQTDILSDCVKVDLSGTEVTITDKACIITK